MDIAKQIFLALGSMCFIISFFYDSLKTIFGYNLIRTRTVKENYERLYAFILDNKEKIYYNKSRERYLYKFEFYEIAAYFKNYKYWGVSNYSEVYEIFMIKNNLENGRYFKLLDNSYKFNLFDYFKIKKFLETNIKTNAIEEEYQKSIFEKARLKCT